MSKSQFVNTSLSTMKSMALTNSITITHLFLLLTNPQQEMRIPGIQDLNHKTIQLGFYGTGKQMSTKSTTCCHKAYLPRAAYKSGHELKDIRIYNRRCLRSLVVCCVPRRSHRQFHAPLHSKNVSFIQPTEKPSKGG